MERSLKTESGLNVPTCPLAEWEETNRSEGLAYERLSEGAGYSLAMVVRFALGHSADGGRITAFVNEGLWGAIVLAAVRHLVNGGASASVIAIGELADKTSLELLAQRGVKIHAWNTSLNWESFEEWLNTSHNIVYGVWRPERTYSEQFALRMNESSIPVHVVGLPCGIDPDSGDVIGEPLYASSTLHLGLPLSASLTADDYMGRMYLADLSWNRDKYAALGYTGAPLFSSQPVIRLQYIEPLLHDSSADSSR